MKNSIKNYHREELLNLAYEMGIPIRSTEDLKQFEFELVINGDLPEAVYDQSKNEINPHSNDIKKILELVTKMDSSINPEPSPYQSKKELISARAKADIKRDSITNKRK
ncbi:hypothetical protein ACS5PU_08685 [Pedobacter sp. GSP4]|uniref:hypothetical protein n=1 Tax=Pedobacter sp. GSP4 TaxID=3453716 RepID=UPI003EED9869